MSRTCQQWIRRKKEVLITILSIYEAIIRELLLGFFDVLSLICIQKVLCFFLALFAKWVHFCWITRHAMHSFATQQNYHLHVWKHGNHGLKDERRWVILLISWFKEPSQQPFHSSLKNPAWLVNPHQHVMVAARQLASKIEEFLLANETLLFVCLTATAGHWWT